ncbi:hypothetical protein WJX72_002000 [[Myrmecia] bisecta]|uniref:Fungal lipase-type domain-containing protein n=1 Tax=[Myrmecia] bisecta TaxID=41462 RepID=A0AAW1PX90_9CHLO
MSHASSSSSFSGHYSPRDDVILTLETITARETKVLLFDIRLTVLVSTVALILLTYFKESKPDNYLMKHRRLVLLNLAAGAVCLAMLLYCCATQAHCLYGVWRLKRHWARRRVFLFTLSTLELLFQTLNIIFFIAANAYVAANGCTWFSDQVQWLSFAQWSCWNTLFLILLITASNTTPWLDRQGKPRGRSDATLADAPVTVHTPKLMLWTAYEVLLIVAYAYQAPRPADLPADIPWPPHVVPSNCAEPHPFCNTDPVNTTLVGVICALILFYLLVSMLLVVQSLRRVTRRPYEDYRMANISLRLQLKLRGPAVLLYVASMICLALIGLGSCHSYLFIWLGPVPMQIVQSTVAAVAARISAPRCVLGDKDDPVLQVWLQEHAWCERDIERRKVIRRSSVPGNHTLDDEPMFCFETAFKMFYWSGLVYSFQEADDPEAVDTARSLDLAMSLYKLQHFELIWERKLDTKCLVAWNEDTVVLAFRGTASVANACADLKLWWTAHPPLRGNLAMLNRPMVHSGFLASWLANGMNLRVVECVKRVVSGMAANSHNIKVYATGHSLGGALATLAAYDIRKGCGLAAHTIFCTTFGAPRTGNHAFAWDYNSVVPHTWHIINDQDLVTRKGKLLWMYKRPGQRVLISRLGDLIVRPSWIEVSIRQRGEGSVADHMLTSYQASLAAVCTAQFTKKGLQRGMQGVMDLMLDGPVRKILVVAGVELDLLQTLNRLSKLGDRRRRRRLLTIGGQDA